MVKIGGLVVFSKKEYHRILKKINLVDTYITLIQAEQLLELHEKAINKNIIKWYTRAKELISDLI